MRTYRAIFGEEIPDSITQAVIKSQMPAEIRTSSGAANIRDNRRTHKSHVKLWTASTGASAAAHGPVPMEISWVKNKGESKDKSKGSGKGRRKARAKERTKGRRAKTSRGGATTAESGPTELPTVGTARRNRCTRYKVELARPVQPVRSRQG